MAPPKNAPLLYVEWDDHWGGFGGGWERVDEGHTEPVKCRSVGWIVYEDRRGIKLASTYNNAGRFTGVSYLLKACITKKRRLK